jgi:ring-1,2-phenylacetyl-CoA epoxidase subunit PaaD
VQVDVVYGARVRSDVATLRAALAAVVDPEIPVLTIEDLGILRDVTAGPDGVTVTITPTYSGCPAMEAIREDIEAAFAQAGRDAVHVETVLSPAWTTDWITEDGRRKLRAAGIAPPAPAPARGPVPLTRSRRPVPCPRCGSSETVQTAAFSSTACKALYRCRACAEPFEYVKEH